MLLQVNNILIIRRFGNYGRVISHLESPGRDEHRPLECCVRWSLAVVRCEGAGEIFQIVNKNALILHEYQKTNPDQSNAPTTVPPGVTTDTDMS